MLDACVYVRVYMRTFPLVESPPPLSPVSPSHVDKTFIFNLYQRGTLSFIWNLVVWLGFLGPILQIRKGEALGVS